MFDMEKTHSRNVPLHLLPWDRYWFRLSCYDLISDLSSYRQFALDLPPWAIKVKAIDKICRSFLWRGRKETKVGHCLIA